MPRRASATTATACASSSSTTATSRHAPGSGGAVEEGEDVWHVVGGDADAAVAHGHGDPGVVLAHLHADRRTAGAVLDRVADDIVHHALETRTIAHHHGADGRLHLHNARAMPYDGVVGDGVQHHAHVDGLQMQVERPAHLQAGHVIHLVDRGEHALAGGAEGVHLAAQPYLVDGILGLKAELHHMGTAHRRREGHAQVMRGRAQELSAPG